jgi:hypothetical protein
VEGSEYLLTAAEIGVALAGFAALVVAVRQRGAETLSASDRLLVASLIERGLVASFFSFLPLLLSGLGLARGLVWFIASGMFSAYIISLGWRSAADRRRDAQASELISTSLFVPLMIVGYAMAGIQLAHAFNLYFPQNVWWYLLALTWLLTSAGYVFFFVVRGWVRAA